MPITVVVPTVGRTAMLDDCLASLAACSPRAAEVLVVDQSGSEDVGRVVGRHRDAGVRLLRSAGLGTAVATNEGMAAAAHDVVSVTHDDCVVDRGWVRHASALVGGAQDLLVTGAVLPGDGGEGVVPSTKTDTAPADFTGTLRFDALYPNNMAFDRRAALALDGFDPRLRLSEDIDFAYRWLCAGRRMLYRPEMVVWHRDWRDREALERLWVDYYRSQGAFYAKHLVGGDRRVLRFLAADAHRAARHAAARLLGRCERWEDPRSGIVRGLPAGLLSGMRLFLRERRRGPLA